MIKQCLHVRQEAKLSLEWTDGTTYVQKPASDFRSRKESDFSQVTKAPYTLC